MNAVGKKIMSLDHSLILYTGLIGLTSWIAIRQSQFLIEIQGVNKLLREQLNLTPSNASEQKRKRPVGRPKKCKSARSADSMKRY